MTTTNTNTTTTTTAARNAGQGLGLSGLALDIFIKAGGPARHHARRAAVLSAAARAATGTDVPPAVATWLLGRVDQDRIGFRAGVATAGGHSTRRVGAFAALGKGRRQASDGPAWDAAIEAAIPAGIAISGWEGGALWLNGEGGICHRIPVDDLHQLLGEWLAAQAAACIFRAADMAEGRQPQTPAPTLFRDQDLAWAAWVLNAGAGEMPASTDEAPDPAHRIQTARPCSEA